MAECTNHPAITPETKIGKLLEHYPQLEDVLLDLAPVFAKLRNPVLRKTVARVATLRQAAQVGGISLGTLINKLRAAVGVQSGVTPVEGGLGGSGERPEWAQPENIVRSLDARPMIESGQQPMTAVLRGLEDLQPGQVYELLTPFVPAPLIDLARQRGFDCWWTEESPEVIKSLFHRPEAM